MWNQRASVMVYPLVGRFTIPSPPIHTVLPPLLRPPPALSDGELRAASPAGLCLFISSEAAMINEALNTSSLFSLGPGEAHS